MSMSVQSSSRNEMVKPLITRKSRQFQTALERWSTLRQSSSRSFDRLNFRNRREEDRLTRKYRHINDLSEAQLKEIFRVKNEMRVTLVDIAKNKRRMSSSESEFESKLRTGQKSPVFQMEYRRLKHKQLELGKLSEQLKGPNSKLLALNLNSELKNVEAKTEREAARKEGKFKGKWLAPLQAIQQAKGEDAEKPNSSGTLDVDEANTAQSDFASLVKLVHKEFKKASISEQNAENTSADMSDRIEQREGIKAPALASLVRNMELSQRATRSPGLYPVSRPPKGLIPLEPSHSPPSSVSVTSTSSTAEAKRNKRHIKDVDKSLPSVPELPELSAPSPPASPKPPLKKWKKQKRRLPDIKGAPGSREVSRTESARRRDKIMQRRLSDLAAKTKEDIKNRRSVSPDELMKNINANEALNSIQKAEVVARLQLARSKVGIPLPELTKGKKKTNGRSGGRTGAEVSLPPINIEGRLLQELKEQRRKHKNHSSGLPKLP